MRTKFAILLAIAAVVVTTVWAGWSPEALITGNSAGRSLFSNNGRKVVFGPDGVGHVIWGGGGVGCNRYDPLTGWSSDCQVSPRGGNPSIALDADGTTIHAVWEDTGSSAICYQKCVRKADGSDGWGPIVTLAKYHSVYVPSVASVPGEPNHVVVCWMDYVETQGRGGNPRSEAIGFIECIGGVWGTAIRLDQAGMRRLPSIAVSPNGDVFIAYFACDDNLSGCQVYVKTRHNGTLGTHVDVTTGLLLDKCEFPAIEVNPYTGNPHVIFPWMKVTQISKKVKQYNYAVRHTYRNSLGAWLPTPELISVPYQGNGYGFPANDPTMAFLSGGAAYAVWNEPFPVTSHGNMYSYNAVEGGAWSAPAWLTSDPSSSYKDDDPRVAVDEYAQTVRAVWNRLYPGMGWETEIWWRSGALGGGGGQAQPMALSQSGIGLFPNPAKAGRVTAQYSLPCVEPVRVTLLDVSGRAVRTQEVAATDRSGSFSIDVSGLSAGVYVARLVARDLNVSKSLVIER